MRLRWLIPVITSVSLAHASQVGLTFLSEQNPPVNYQDNNQHAAGFSVDLLHLIWEEMSEPQQSIQFLPWARAYYITQTEPGSVLFATSRTSERENMFKWVCPISTSNVVLIQRKNEYQDLSSQAALKKLTIGVVRADIAEDVVIAQTHNKIKLFKARNIEQLILLLQSHKVDMIATYEPVFYTTLQQNGIDPANYPRKLILQQMTDCYAFNRATSDSVIKKYQDALTKVRHSQKYNDLLERYQMLNFK